MFLGDQLENSDESLFLNRPKGDNNLVADTLSCFDISNDPFMEKPIANYIGKYFALIDNDLPSNTLPISFKTLMCHQ